MSYSFTVRGRNLACALAAATAAFDKLVVQPQPVHSHDRDAALANASNIANTLSAQPEGSMVVVSMHGSLSWGTPTAGSNQFTNCNSSVSVFYVPESGGSYETSPDCATLGVPEPA